MKRSKIVITLGAVSQATKGLYGILPEEQQGMPLAGITND